jgi:pilus assembly protein FimV
MLVSLYRANQQAFSGNNMNRLKTGQILRIPEGGQVAALEKNEATKEVRAHAADWHAYRQKLAGAVETAKPAHEDQARQVAGGKITTAMEDKAAGAKEPVKDVLKLSKSESVGGKPGRVVAPEDVIARDKALQEANQRIAELEKNIKDMQRLLEIRSQGMAELQKSESTPPAPPPAAEKAPEAAPVASAPVEQPIEQVKPKPKPKVVTLQAKPPAPAPSFLDELLGNPLVLGGGALAVLLGGLFGARAIKARRKMGEGKVDKGVRGGIAGKAVQPGSMPSDILPEVSSALTDFTQSGLGGIDTNEVDPIAEAEVYMAYGRDVQAEEILREAMARDPQRHEIHLKLLEIYAGRKDRGSYEALARQLYAATGGTPDPDWEKTAEMGRALDAGNPLYGAAEMPAAMPVAMEEALGEPIDLGEAQEAVDTSPDLDFNLGVGESPESGVGAALEGAPAEAPMEELAPDLDFDLGLEEAAPQAEEKTPDADENLLDFNLEVPEPVTAETPPVAAEAPAEAVEDEHGLNFNLEFPSAASAVEVEKAEELLDQEQPEMPALEEGLISAEPQELAASEPVVPEMADLEMPGLEMLGLELPVPPSEEVPAAGAEASAEASFDETMLLNLSDLAAEQPAASETPAAEPESAEAEHESILISPPAMSDEAMLDFDFDIGEETPPPMAPSVDLSGIDLSLSAPATDGDAASALNLEDATRFQDAATKMDLAKAYMEMGDKEGASEILQEVMLEGSDEQREDAKKLLAEIG